MDIQAGFFDALTSDEFAGIKALGRKRSVEAGATIFSAGDDADSLYFIDSGNVSICIQKFTQEEEVCRLGAGDYFGEMGLVSEQSRSASANRNSTAGTVKTGSRSPRRASKTPSAACRTCATCPISTCATSPST